MHKTDAANNSAGLFVDGDPAIPVIGTEVDAKWLNQVQAELLAILTEASITPDYTNSAQVLAAIYALWKPHSLTCGNGFVGANTLTGTFAQLTPKVSNYGKRSALSGIVVNSTGSPITKGTVFATLPSGSRPYGGTDYTVAGFSAFSLPLLLVTAGPTGTAGFVEIQFSGDMSFSEDIPAGGYADLSGVSFFNAIPT